MKELSKIFLPLFLCIPLLGNAQDDQSEADKAIHDELRSLRDKIGPSKQKWDINKTDQILELFHEDAVFTPMNSEVCRGPDQIRAFFSKMLSGPNPTVESVSFDFTVDSLTMLYGGEGGVKDTGVAYGVFTGHYELKSGLQFEVLNHWTATLVKEDGKWLIASLHGSSNMFDNPLLNNAKRSIYWVGGIAVIVGIILGMVIMKFLKRRTRSS